MFAQICDWLKQVQGLSSLKEECDEVVGTTSTILEYLVEELDEKNELIFELYNKVIFLERSLNLLSEGLKLTLNKCDDMKCLGDSLSDIATNVRLCVSQDLFSAEVINKDCKEILEVIETSKFHYDEDDDDDYYDDEDEDSGLEEDVERVDNEDSTATVES
jgi:hypothetical protein